MASHAIITAAGRGKRMGLGVNKCLLPLAGKELLAHTISAFEECIEVDCVVLTAGSSDEIEEFRGLCARHGFKKVKGIVLGGKERQDSVFSGLVAVKDAGARDDDVVLVHNGANPLVSQGDIISAISAAREHGAGVCALECRDTIKEVDREGFVVRTHDRSSLRAMQTPQSARMGLFWSAFSKAREQGFLGTDDVQLVERIGGRVKVVPCSPENFKITSPKDLELAERILEERKMKRNLEGEIEKGNERSD